MMVLRKGHYWDTDKSLPFIKKFGDANSIDALVALLLADHYRRDRSAVAEALIALCKSNPDVDLKTRVHEPILRQVHDLYSQSADDIWRVLRATNFDAKLLIQQTLNDLTSPDSSRERSAWETMSRMDVDESLRSLVTDKMETLLETEKYVNDRKRSCFVRWAKPQHPLLIKWLHESYLSADGFQEVMSAVVNAPVTPELLVVIANAFADRKKQRPMYEILATQCEDPATIAVGLCESTSPVVLQAACQILGARGTHEHMKVLAALNSKAKKARVAAVVIASREAGRKIRARHSK